MPQLAPPAQTRIADRRGHMTPALHRHLLTLAGRLDALAAEGPGGGGTPSYSEPLVTGADPTEFITADGDVIVTVV